MGTKTCTSFDPGIGISIGLHAPEEDPESGPDYRLNALDRRVKAVCNRRKSTIMMK
jgi:hypothetical protein